MTGVIRRPLEGQFVGYDFPHAKGKTTDDKKRGMAAMERGRRAEGAGRVGRERGDADGVLTQDRRFTRAAGVLA